MVNWMVIGDCYVMLCYVTIGEASGVKGERSILWYVIEGRDIRDVNGLESHLCQRWREKGKGEEKRV